MTIPPTLQSDEPVISEMRGTYLAGAPKLDVLSRSESAKASRVYTIYGLIHS